MVALFYAERKDRMNQRSMNRLTIKDGKILLDDLRINNVQELHITFARGGRARVTIELDVYCPDDVSLREFPKSIGTATIRRDSIEIVKLGEEET